MLCNVRVKAGLTLHSLTILFANPPVLFKIDIDLRHIVSRHLKGFAFIPFFICIKISRQKCHSQNVSMWKYGESWYQIMIKKLTKSVLHKKTYRINNGILKGWANAKKNKIGDFQNLMVSKAKRMCIHKGILYRKKGFY